MADHNFNPLLAKKYGINLAIIINTAIFWTRSNAAKEDNFFNERYWFYGTPEYFSKYFPYFTPDQIKYALKKGKQCGVFLKGNFNKKGYDRTGWYSLSDEILKEVNLDRTCLYPYGYNNKQNEQNKYQESPQNQAAPHRVILPNASGKITPTIPVNKSINKKDINTIGDSSNTPNEKSVDNYKDDPLFTKFYLNYPNKQKPKEAYKEFKKLKPTEEFVSMLVDDINKRRSKDKRWQSRQYIPHPTTYLKTEYWMGDIITEDKPKQKYPTKEERAENEKQIKRREEEAARLKKEEIEASKNFKDTLFQ